MFKDGPHDSGLSHALGESIYVDDRSILPRELHVGVIASEYAHAEVLEIDISGALQIPGVAAVFTSADLAQNHWGTIFQDQPVLASEHVEFVGEPVAIVAVENRQLLEIA